jgi:hypothetical protein
MLGRDGIDKSIQQTLDEKKIQDLVAYNFNLDPEQLAAEKSAQLLAEQAELEEEYEQAHDQDCRIGFIQGVCLQ